MSTSPTSPTIEELDQADDLVFHLLKRRAQAIAKASLIEPDAPLSATDLNVLKELRRSSRDLRARIEAAEPEKAAGSSSSCRGRPQAEARHPR